MPVIGITGGVATGKSSFAEILCPLVGGHLFNADVAARRLTETDPAVRAEIRERFGPDIFGEGEDLNRAALRSIILADAAKKLALEQILHPRIRAEWQREAVKARGTSHFFLADIPLLYETGGETLCDLVVVVACSPEIQRQRLMKRSSLKADTAARLISSQMPLTEKILRADHLVWNNNGLEGLRAQAELLAAYWKK